MYRMAPSVVFLLILSVFVQNSLMQDLECYVPEPSTRIMLLNPNLKELTVIQNGSTLPSSSNTYMVVHGWQEWPTRKDNLNLARALVEQSRNNVLLLDYSKWSQKFYNCAYEMVEEAGQALAKFIVDAVNVGGIQMETLHLIGYSLGGHVIGYAGRQVNNMLGERVHRITALDPAGPLFTKPFTFDTSLTLAKTDANVVDVLHTTTLLGTRCSLGTVDFYAESSFEDGMQPACLTIGCSHGISRKYYIESIYSCGIKAMKHQDYCKSSEEEPTEEDLVIFGHNMLENTTGKYSFVAANKKPYGKYPITCPKEFQVNLLFS